MFWLTKFMEIIEYVEILQATNPYLAGMPQVGSTFSPYFSPPIMSAMMPDPATQLGMVQQTVVTQQKMPRSDRLEVSPPPLLLP